MRGDQLPTLWLPATVTMVAEATNTRTEEFCSLELRGDAEKGEIPKLYIEVSLGYQNGRTARDLRTARYCTVFHGEDD